MNRRTLKTLSKTERAKTTRRKLKHADDTAQQQREEALQFNRSEQAQGTY